MQKIAREDEPEEPKVPQVVEREIDLSLINAKLNEATGILLRIANKLEIDLED